MTVIGDLFGLKVQKAQHRQRTDQSLHESMLHHQHYHRLYMQMKPYSQRMVENAVIAEY